MCCLSVSATNTTNLTSLWVNWAVSQLRFCFPSSVGCGGHFVLLGLQIIPQQLHSEIFVKIHMKYFAKRCGCSKEKKTICYQHTFRSLRWKSAWKYIIMHEVYNVSESFIYKNLFHLFIASKLFVNYNLISHPNCCTETSLLSSCSSEMLKLYIIWSLWSKRVSSQ